MYKIAPIHKQRHYFHCLPTVLSLFLFSFFSHHPFPTLSPLFLLLPYTQIHTLSILSKATFKVYFAKGFFCGHGVIWKRVENYGAVCSIDARNQILQVEKLPTEWLTVKYNNFSHIFHCNSIPLFIVLSFCQTFHTSVGKQKRDGSLTKPARTMLCSL